VTAHTLFTGQSTAPTVNGRDLAPLTCTQTSQQKYSDLMASN